MRIHLMLIFVLFNLCCVQSAFAKYREDGDIIAGLGVAVNQLDTQRPPDLSQTPKRKTENGFFASAEGYFNNWFSIEVDFIFGTYQFVREVKGQVLNESVSRVHVPILFKFTFFKYFDIGIGPYASYKMGEVKEINDLAISEEDRTSANDMGEHGLEVSAGFIFPLEDSDYALGFDFRESYSLTPRVDEERFYTSILFMLKKDL